MVALVLVFCLINGGGACKEVRPDLQGYVSVIGCMQQAQFAAAAQLNMRPDLQGYRLTKWRCELGVPKQTTL